uniref:Uncharacterized protein n=1 Tax=Arundo donax TaxID=35708 RepID=A0A0A8YM74_ARUDO
MSGCVSNQILLLYLMNPFSRVYSEGEAFGKLSCISSCFVKLSS